MVRHLVGTGHRDIAFVAGPPDNHDARERLRGYRDELASALPASRGRVVPGGFDEASGAAAAASLIATGTLPDAVFAANDAMAIGCLRAFVQAGIRVPDDVALAGFDDIPLSRHVQPPLTTMRVDIAALGATALRVLLGMAPAGVPAPQGGQLASRLVVRASTRCGGVHAADNHGS